MQSPSWEANRFAASQEIPRISWNPKVHYHTHKRLPPVPILGQPNPVHIPTFHLLEIHPNIIHPSTPRSSQWSPSLRLPYQDPVHPLSSPRHATCPAHLILLDFITRTILGEEYRSFSPSLCNLLHSPVTSSLLGSNILLNTMFSNTLSFLFSILGTSHRPVGSCQDCTCRWGSTCHPYFSKISDTAWGRVLIYDRWSLREIWLQSGSSSIWRVCFADQGPRSLPKRTHYSLLKSGSQLSRKSERLHHPTGRASAVSRTFEKTNVLHSLRGEEYPSHSKKRERWL